MNEANLFGALVIGIIVLFAGLVFFVTIVQDDEYGFSFCERHGYDAASFSDGGSYSEYFGKIECYSSFKNERVTKIFNVERKWGRFDEVSREGE